MNHLNTLVAGLAAVALTVGVAIAQTTPPTPPSGSMPSSSAPAGAMPSDTMQSGAMNKGAMSSGSMKMSKGDMSTMKSCQSMPHDAMMGDAKCKGFMAAHPDMFNADGTMKPQ